MHSKSKLVAVLLDGRCQLTYTMMEVINLTQTKMRGGSINLDLLIFILGVMHQLLE